MRLPWSVRAIAAIAEALLPRRVFLALVAPVVAESAGRGWRGALRVLAALMEQLGRYALLVPRDWLAEADFTLRGWLRASLEPTPAAPAALTEVSMSLGDRMLSTENPAARRRAIAGTVAIALHAAAIVVAVVWSFAKVEELPAPPPLGIAFIHHLPKPPPPPPPKAPRAKDALPPKGKRTTAVDVAPVVAPQKRVDSEPAAKDEPDEPGETCAGADCAGDPEGQGPPGSGPGEPGGTGTGPAPAPEAPMRFIPPTWRQPERVAGVDPAYTPAAKAARLDGSVKLKVCFDKQGVVTSAQVLQGMAMGMTEAAVQTVRGWRYRPYLVSGQAIRGCVLTTINFTLR